MKYNVRRRCNSLTTRSRAIRVKNTQSLSTISGTREEALAIFYEKNFFVDEIASGQNTRVTACYLSDVPRVIQTKKLASVIVFAAVSSSGKVMSHFIQDGLEINTGSICRL